MKSVTLPTTDRMNELAPIVGNIVNNDAVTARVIEALSQHAGMTHTGRELAIIVKDVLWASVSHGELERESLPDTLSCTFLWLGEFLLDNDVLTDATEEFQVWETYFSQS